MVGHACAGDSCIPAYVCYSRGMDIFGSGSKRDDVRTVNLSFKGADREFVHLIDELDRLARETGSELLLDIMRQINWRAACPVDHPKPAGVLTIKGLRTP